MSLPPQPDYCGTALAGVSVRGRIIVADDDIVTAHLLCALLRRGGFQPEAVADVPAIFEACEVGVPPRAILLDMHMPGGTGTDALARLRMLAPHIPVIIVSGTSYEGSSTDGRARAFGHLRKPVDPGALMELLRRATEHGSP